MAPELTEHHFNPAGRLYNFVTYTTEQGNLLIEEVWSGYFDAKPNSPQYLMGLSAVLDLPRQVMRAVDALHPDAVKYRSKDKLLRPLPSVRNAIGVGIANQRSGADLVTNELAAADLFDLEICSDVLRGNWQSDGNLPSSLKTMEESIHKTLKLADELSEALGDLPDLDAELRFTLLDAVQRIRRSVDLYRVLGPEALGQARDQLVGSVVMNPTVANEVRKNPNIGTKVAALVVVLGSFVSLFNGTMTAVETTTTFLKTIEVSRGEPAIPDIPNDSGKPEAP
jgi:hypothetical protein